MNPKVDIRDDKVLGFVCHTRRAQASAPLSLLLQECYRQVEEKEKW